MITRDINLTQLLIIYAMLAVPAAILAVFRTGLVRRTLIAIVRMSLQLALVGLYLQYVFDLNNPWLNVAWFMIMVTIASANVVSSANLRTRALLPMVLIGIGLSTSCVLAVFVFAALRPQPFYDARYLIPIGGMILGNCMRGNVISLQRFFSGIRDNGKEYMSSLFMGATVTEAARPWVRSSLTAALSPTISTMATMGIVSLPGMMTGQILGGSDPVTAVTYQTAIMVAIFVAVAMGAWLNLALCTRAGFNEYGMLRDDIFRS